MKRLHILDLHKTTTPPGPSKLAKNSFSSVDVSTNTSPSDKEVFISPQNVSDSHAILSKSSIEQTGFTLVELMISSAVFSVILLLVSMATIQIGRVYYKGITSSYTQEVARTIIEDISESIQVSGETVQSNLPALPALPPAGRKGFCVGPRRYSYLDNGSLMLKDTSGPGLVKHVLVVDVLANCNGSTYPQDINGAGLTANSREMLGENMRLAKLEVKESTLVKGFYDITVRIVFGDKDLLCSASVPGDCASTTLTPYLTSTDLSCKSLTGSQFCSVSELTTTVQRRIQ